MQLLIILCHYRYEASSDAQLEPKEQLPWYQEGRVFQHYTNLGTYTLTFPSWQHRVEGAEKDGDESCCIKKEIEELRRLIQLHRDSKVTSSHVHTAIVSSIIFYLLYSSNTVLDAASNK